MIHDALRFLLLAFVAAVVGLFGVAAAASRIAWVLFVMGLGLVVTQHFVKSRDSSA